ncbi:MAG TPA: MupA/Atu3671 family FMN-dependent luciferase-like monooxygenase, partial [Thermoanaerobaculia bacterium]|nr:MupA/Atu3671 family FMN-dependent luciferase-like monooxygenase [Thermoanaerobaculia bacterium]
ADRHGFAAVWTPERHFHAFGGLYPSPAVTSAAIATITERVAIRAGSVVLPLHQPIRVAEEWSMIDNLSRGRVGISFASGWHADDFVLAPESYAERKDVMLRGIETVRRLWRGEAVRARGGAGREVEVRILPRPLQPELPVWVTAAGNAETFRLAGEIRAGVLTHLLGQDLDDLERKIAVYRRAWSEGGRGPGGGHVTLMLHAFVGEDEETVRATVKGPFCNYLRASLDLVRNLSRGLGREIDPGALSPADLEEILERSFERYYQTSALLGTEEGCLRLVDRLKRAGVDEIACLIDFGIADETVLAGLSRLDALRRRANEARPAAPAAEELSLVAALGRYGVTHFQCTPTVAKVLAGDAAGRRALASLDHLLVGGEALPLSLLEQLGDERPRQLHNMYGPTETTVWSATWTAPSRARRIAIGRPIANTEIYVVDHALRPVPAGVPGELLIGGLGVTRGYLGRPDLTAERFVPDPFGPRAGGRLYRTGDLARFRIDGELEFLGRIDQQVKVHGYRIELEEIERALERHPGIAQAVVAAHEDAGNRHLVAYFVPARKDGTAGPEPWTGRYHRLPNGLRVACFNDFQASQA